MRVLCVLASAAVLIAGCSDDPPSSPDASGPALYTTTFDVPRERVDRDSELLDVVVDDGTCDREHPERTAERFERADVARRPGAFVVTVWMREEDWQGACAGVGVAFRRRIALPEPLGERAVLDAGGPGARPEVRLPPRTSG